METRPVQIWFYRLIKRTALICLLVVFFLSSAMGQNWENGTFEEAQTKARASGRLLLLDFFQEYG